ncbi:MAG: branched-chain amino acid ABC transporter permease [Sphaerochaetaceae bacterium]
MSQIIINGIMLGMSYSLIALGLTLVFGIMNIVNFAHGQMYMLGGFIIYYVYAQWGLNFFVALLFAALLLGVIGLVFEKAFFRRFLRESRRPESSMLLAIGTAKLLESVALILFGEKHRGVTPFITGVVSFMGAYIPKIKLFIFIMSFILILGLLIFIKKTSFGLALLAIVQDKEVTKLMGVDTNRLSMIGFAIGAALAGISGGLLTLSFPIYAGMGSDISIKSFIMIMIGGAGVVPGAIVGGFILGMLESFGYGFIPGSATYLLIFLLVILLLIFKPLGIMGKPGY